MATVDASRVSSHLNEEHDEKFEKIVYKRRSSIFYKQSVTSDQQKSGNEVSVKIDHVLNKDKEVAQADAETFDLKEYIKKLKQERKYWEQEYRKHKNERKTLTKQKTNAESQGQLLDLNVLTEEQRTFILSRPNYENICKKSQDLSKMASKISILSQVVHKSNQNFMRNMENNISRVTKDIIETLNY